MVNFDNTRFTDYFSFGSSAMSRHVESGMLRGRPFGGVLTIEKLLVGPKGGSYWWYMGLQLAFPAKLQ